MRWILFALFFSAPAFAAKPAAFSGNYQSFLEEIFVSAAAGMKTIERCE